MDRKKRSPPTLAEAKERFREAAGRLPPAVPRPAGLMVFVNELIRHNPKQVVLGALFVGLALGWSGSLRRLIFSNVGRVLRALR